MIVRPMGDHIRLIAQHDHARAAGALARCWRGSAMVPPVPEGLREALFFAVDNHDVGWCEPDSSPHLDPETRLPFSFFGVTAEEATVFWAKGISVCEHFRPFSGYLVSRHFCLLAEAGLRGAPPDEGEFLKGFLDREGKRQGGLLDEMTGDEDRAREPAVMLLRTCDTLSLLACRAPEIAPPAEQVHPLARSGLRVRLRGEEGLEVGPWPFTGESIALKFPGQAVARRNFASDQDFRDALEAAEPFVCENVVTPLREPAP